MGEVYVHAGNKGGKKDGARRRALKKEEEGLRKEISLRWSQW